MNSIGRFFISRLQGKRKEIARVLIFLSYIVVLTLMALAFWPVLKVFLFLAIFFGLLLLIIVVFRFI